MIRFPELSSILTYSSINFYKTRNDDRNIRHIFSEMWSYSLYNLRPIKSRSASKNSFATSKDEPLMIGKLCQRSSVESINPSAVVNTRNVVEPSWCVWHLKVSRPLTLKSNEFFESIKTSLPSTDKSVYKSRSYEHSSKMSFGIHVMMPSLSEQNPWSAEQPGTPKSVEKVYVAVMTRLNILQLKYMPVWGLIHS
jgi:hypothetical protein